MSKPQISDSKQKSIRLYDYDRIIHRTFTLMQKDLNENDVELIKKFDRVLKYFEKLGEGFFRKVFSKKISRRNE